MQNWCVNGMSCPLGPLFAQTVGPTGHTSGLMLTSFDGKSEQARLQARSQDNMVRMQLKYEPKKYGVPMFTNLDINTVACFS